MAKKGNEKSVYKAKAAENTLIRYADNSNPSWNLFSLSPPGPLQPFSASGGFAIPPLYHYNMKQNN